MFSFGLDGVSKHACSSHAWEKCKTFFYCSFLTVERSSFIEILKVWLSKTVKRLVLQRVFKINMKKNMTLQVYKCVSTLEIALAL